MSKVQNACGKHRSVATVSVPTRRHTMRKSFVALAGLGVAGLLTAGAAQASVLPAGFHGTHPTKVAPAVKQAPAKAVPVNTTHALFVYPRDVAAYQSAGYTCIVVRSNFGKATLYSCSLGG